MASETKVGLIAGLTFIICFAVILANRGPQELMPQQGGFRVDGPAPRAAGDWQLQPQARMPQQIHTPPGRSASAPPVAVPVAGQPDHRARAAQRLNEQRGVASSAQRIGNSRPKVARSAQGNRFRSSVDPGVLRRHASQGDVDGRSLISSSSGADARLARLEQRLNQLADDVKAADTPHTVRVDKSPPKRAPAVRRGPPKSGPRIMPAASPSQQHTVVSGDTLSKIAAGHYGGSSMRFVNAIFDANRALLTSPDQLRPGMELVLPTIEGVITPRSAKSSASLETDNRRTSLPQPEVPRTPSRWYQIQQDDRYVSIAREQLGDARRWPEIHELNKDKFPDPGLIRTGVRIRLPLKLVAAATERRR